jgi:Do/DeqQ family serine protease
MNRFFKFPAAKIFGAFLAGMLVVAAVVVAGNFHGLPHLSWADETNQGNITASASAPLPGLGPDTIPDLVSKASPAVVRIDTTEQVSGGQYDPFFNDPFFRQFFGNQFRAPSRPQVSHGLGSGFIVSPDGYILTNEHVIEGADQIQVTVAGQNKSFPATKVGSDHQLDLAVLKINAGGNLPTLPLGNSDNIRVGDWVVAIGNPYGLDHTVTVGVISAKGRPVDVQDRSYRNLLQTDASINPGNSGGPLLNLNGEVVGINTAVNAQAQGIGFAIPSSTVQSVFNELVQKGSVSHPYLGVYLQSAAGDQSGALIASVIKDGPADKAGLQKGDLVTGFNGKEITNPNDLVNEVGSTPVGSQVEVQFVRGGETKTTTVTVEAKSS